jgi:hypothetical protein
MRILLFLASVPTALALRLSRRVTLQQQACCAASSLLWLGVPLRATAAGAGKDLYKGDVSSGILSGGSGGLVDSVSLPQFGEDGSLLDGAAQQDAAFVRLSEAKASVQRPASWVATPDGGLSDPVIGSVASSLRFSARPTQLRSIADAGRPEELELVSALGLEAGLARSDLIAAARREADGIVYYEFDLALPAAKCSAELAGACLPTLVVLLGVAVRDGQLHLVRIDASPAEWRRAGRALKALRSSFAISS